MADIEATRTYLELKDRAQLRPAPLDRRARVERVVACPVSYFRFLYAEVGKRYHWRDRYVWTDAQCRARIEQPGVELWVLYSAGAPAGYFELELHDDDAVEIVYFGLLPEFVGHGLGKQMLTAAAQRGWEMGAKRVWLHTCTLDNPAALPNYLKRGFTPFKTEQFTLPVTPPAHVTDAPPPA